jgi:hypothetical protein
MMIAVSSYWGWIESFDIFFKGKVIMRDGVRRTLLIEENQVMKTCDGAASGVGVDNAKDATKVRIGDLTPAHLFAELKLLSGKVFRNDLWQSKWRQVGGAIRHNEVLGNNLPFIL